MEFSDNHKSISKINGYMEKDKLPILKYYSTKNKNNSTKWEFYKIHNVVTKVKFKIKIKSI